MARPRTEEPEIRRIKILDATREVLVTKGYQDFRMSDVAKRADIAIGTLYLYFRDKLDIFAAVFIDLLDRMDKRIQTATKGLDGLVALRKTAHESLAFVDEYQDFLFQFTGEHPALMESETGLILKERYVHHLDTISRLIQGGIKSRDLRPVNVSLAALHFSWLVRMFMVNKILSQSKSPLSSRTKELMEIFLKGMGR